jgi:hypothetical protein
MTVPGGINGTTAVRPALRGLSAGGGGLGDDPVGDRLQDRGSQRLVLRSRLVRLRPEPVVEPGQLTDGESRVAAGFEGLLDDREVLLRRDLHVLIPAEGEHGTSDLHERRPGVVPHITAPMTFELIRNLEEQIGKLKAELNR